MVQIINCPCGETIAACMEPECYKDVEWQRSMRAYVKKGYTVKMANKGEWSFGKCACSTKSKVAEKQLQLFN